MSKRSEAKARKARAQAFKNPKYYIGKQFIIISANHKITSFGDNILQVFCEDEDGNKIAFAFTNPAALQTQYTPGQSYEMSHSTDGGLVDFVWLA